MSADRNFTLEPTGPRVGCDFRGCILDAWHEGDHQFAAKPAIEWNYDRHCVVCGVAFTVLGAEKSMIFDTCGSQECLLHFARRHAADVPLMCCCPQRSHPHELSVHPELRREAHHPRLRDRWPWSLMLSQREEPSTERSAR
jgi:hypothetical protein